MALAPSPLRLNAVNLENRNESSWTSRAPLYGSFRAQGSQILKSVFRPRTFADCSASSPSRIRKAAGLADKSPQELASWLSQLPRQFEASARSSLSRLERNDVSTVKPTTGRIEFTTMRYKAL